MTPGVKFANAFPHKVRVRSPSLPLRVLLDVRTLGRGAGWRRSRSLGWQTRGHTALGAKQAGHRTESTGRGERYTRWV